MKLTIHRGTHEIGGSCVEIESQGTRIVIDIGAPLQSPEGKRFEISDYKSLPGPELVKRRILPDVKGFYSWDEKNKPVNGLLISHAHIDHYGLFSYLSDDIHYYLGEGARRLIEMTGLFVGYDGNIKKYTKLKSGSVFQIGSFKITPYLMDHSAFDAYAFLIESDGKSILYSGDFREHGRKTKAFEWFLHKTYPGMNALLLEGSLLGRTDGGSKKEEDIEKEIINLIKKTGTIVFGISSSQNIDRMISFYRASLKTKRAFVIDVYTANILDGLKDLAKVPYPSEKYKNIRVFFPKGICDKLSRKNRKDLMYKFKEFKITKEEISENLKNIVMMIKPSMVFDLSRIKGIQSAPVIYSMWEGYLNDESSRRLKQFVQENGMNVVKMHTSGHASVKTLQKVINRLKPKQIVPIHTFYPERYAEIFPGTPVLNASDGVEIKI